MTKKRNRRNWYSKNRRRRAESAGGRAIARRRKEKMEGTDKCSSDNTLDAGSSLSETSISTMNDGRNLKWQNKRKEYSGRQENRDDGGLKIKK